MDANRLKRQAIKEFDYLISRLEKGYKIKHSNVLNIICLLEIYPDIENGDYLASTLIHG